MANLMDGRRLAAEIRHKVLANVQALSASGVRPGVGLVLAGTDPASRAYYDATLRACGSVGVQPHCRIADAGATAGDLLNTVSALNADANVHGILLLMPLPRGMDARKVVNAIAPEKDIDGVSAISVGRLAADESVFQIFRQGRYELFEEAALEFLGGGFLPCTPFGVVRLLEYHGVAIRGRHAVVVGKSVTVGKPLALMLLARGATVTVCHRDTADLGAFTRTADILCSATGVPGLVRGEMIKPGAAVVDVGYHAAADGTVLGDVDFAGASARAALVTPVPGGVGPVTIAMLLDNTVRSARRQTGFHPGMG